MYGNFDLFRPNIWSLSKNEYSWNELLTIDTLYIQTYVVNVSWRESEMFGDFAVSHI